MILDRRPSCYLRRFLIFIRNKVDLTADDCGAKAEGVWQEWMAMQKRPPAHVSEVARTLLAVAVLVVGKTDLFAVVKNGRAIDNIASVISPASG